MMNKFLTVLLLSFSLISFSQAKKIQIESSEFTEADDTKFPDIIQSYGNVKMNHEGVKLTCDAALLYKKTNIFKALGNVVIEQGDTIIQYSDFAIYNGNTKIAKSWGNVEINDQKMKLSTDTLYFDRVKQLLYYPSDAIIRDDKNTLKSTKGYYYTQDKKFEARTNVSITNSENSLITNHLDYYVNDGVAYLYGPSTITNLKDSTRLYAERGFHNTKTNISYFVKKSKLYLKNRIVEADSMYYDKNNKFASASHNIKVSDTINKTVIKGNFSEIFEAKDSVYITDRAEAILYKKNDSTHIHGNIITATGKKNKRLVRAYHQVKIFKSNVQGKCDSLSYYQPTGMAKMYRKPVLWLQKRQVTGDSIQFMNNVKTKKLDSLFIYNNALFVEKDSISGKYYNQLKGRNIFGKFKNNSLKTLLVKGNAETLFYNRNKKTSLIESITKQISSDIEFEFKKKKLLNIKYFKKVDGTTYPLSKLPNDIQKLKGFIWREEERPLTKEDIFKKSSSVKEWKNKKTNLKRIEAAKSKFKKESEAKQLLEERKDNIK